MDTATREKFEARANIIKAMGHPTRLFMVHELENGEQCVCNLQAKVCADISTISRHLATLKQAGSYVAYKAGARDRLSRYAGGAGDHHEVRTSGPG